MWQLTRFLLFICLAGGMFSFTKIELAQAEQNLNSTTVILSTWPVSKKFVDTIKDVVIQRIEDDTFAFDGNIRRLIRTSWVDRIGNVYVLYSPVFRTFIFIRSNASGQITDIRLVLLQEALRLLNLDDLVKDDSASLMGRFTNGADLIGFWRRLHADGIDVLGMFLDRYDAVIDIRNPLSVDLAQSMIIYSWIRPAEEAALRCLHSLTPLLSNATPDGPLGAFMQLLPDERRLISVADVQPHGDEGMTVILNETKFSRSFIFIIMTMDCQFRNSYLHRFYTP